MPSNPEKVLDRLFIKPPSAKRPIYTLPDQIASSLVLLKSSSFSGSELRNSNITFNAIFS